MLGVDKVTAAELVASSPARATGDPHLITLDGLNYDLQAVGEFELASVPAAGVEVQARFTAARANLSVVNAVALELDGSPVELRSDGSVLIDGEPVDVQEGAGFTFADGSYLVRQDGKIQVSWPAVDDGNHLALTWESRNGIGSVGLSVPASLAGGVRGLLGDRDGNPMNDLRLRDGTPVRADASPAYLHDAYADSWRLTDSESMFLYLPGESTATFTDKAFPASIVTRGDFTPAQQAAAMATCQSYGVAAGPSFDDCQLDVMATGNWAFAAAAASVRVPSVVAGDRMVDSSGYAGTDFEGTLPNNFSASRMASDPAVTSFAGPFTGTEQYRFYVPSLPGHDRVDLSFDVLSFGTWDQDDTVQVAVDDKNVPVTLDWAQAQSGTLGNGTAYRLLHVSVPVAHHLSQLAVTVTGSGLSGAAGQGFGVDNIGVNLRLVPAQSFNVPAQRGALVRLNTETGEGAGTLETRGSIDRYSLNLPAGADLDLDWRTTDASIGWRVLGPAEKPLSSGLASDRTARIPNLPDGAVLEVFAVGATPPITQTYDLTALWEPAPQVFDVDIAAGMDVSDAHPGVGAGNLETKASKDVYRFTVPAGGASIAMDFSWPVSGAYANWRLLDASGVIVESGSTSGSRGKRSWTKSLAAGPYQLEITPELSIPGTYALKLYQVPDPQVFDVNAAVGVSVSEGQPATGAGNLETRESQDVYRFTVPAGGAQLQLDYQSVSPAYATRWQVLDSAGHELASWAMRDGDQDITLDSGVYRVVVSTDPVEGAFSATYRMALLLTPAPQVFDVDVATGVDVSDGHTDGWLPGVRMGV